MAVIPGTASSYTHQTPRPDQPDPAPAPAIEEGVPDTSGPSPVMVGTLGTYHRDATLTAEAEDRENPAKPDKGRASKPAKPKGGEDAPLR